MLRQRTKGLGANEVTDLGRVDRNQLLFLHTDGPNHAERK